MAVGIGDTAMLSVQGKVLGQDHVHTLHFRSTAVQDLVTLADAWETNCKTTYRSLFVFAAAPVQLIRAAHICGSIPLNAPYDRSVTAPNGEGTRGETTQPMPSYVAALVNVKGVSSGRRRQGRFFIGGMQELDTDGNVIQTSYLTKLEAYCAALRTTFITAVSPAWRLVVYSKTTAGPGVDCLTSSTLVDSLNVRTAPTTMRSRKLGHGN